MQPDFHDGLLTCYIAATRSNSIRVILDFHPNRVPPAIFLSRRWIAQVVLLAQLVGDTRGRGVEIPRIADNLGAAAAVVGHVAQRGDVDAVVTARARPSAAAAGAAGHADRRPSATAAP